MMYGKHSMRPARFVCGVLAVLFLAAAGEAPAQLVTEPPAELEGVGIDPPDNARVPVDLRFEDEEGTELPLSTWLDGERPVILALVYYRCPMLCGLLLNGLTDALKGLAFTPGDEFEILTVTIDPRETSSLAKVKKQSYLNEYGRPGAGEGWHFLTGDDERIRPLAESVGFGYKYDEETDQYAHATGLFILTPDGRLSRFLSGVMFEPSTLRLALVEASEGKVGTTFDRFLMTCFHFDPDTGQYSLAAFRLVQAGGIMTLIVLAVFVVLVRRAASKRATAVAPPGAEGES
jgi:protein SCO1/2